MTIDPIRRSPGVRRPSRTAARSGGEPEDFESANLPVPVTPARTVPPQSPKASAATIEAQMLGERRGLRGGASVIDQAKVTYNRIEWSGSRDRRVPKGRTAKTDI